MVFQWSETINASSDLLTESSSGTGNDLKNTYLLQEKCIFIIVLLQLKTKFLFPKVETRVVSAFSLNVSLHIKQRFSEYK